MERAGANFFSQDQQGVPERDRGHGSPHPGLSLRLGAPSSSCLHRPPGAEDLSLSPLSSECAPKHSSTGGNEGRVKDLTTRETLLSGFSFRFFRPRD